MQRYPRLVSVLWFAGTAGIIAILIWTAVTKSWEQGLIVALGAMLQAALWSAIMAKPIADQNQACSMCDAATIGALGAGVSLLFLAAPLAIYGAVVRGEPVLNMLLGTFSIGIVALMLTGWLVVPFGAISGILLLKLRGQLGRVPPQS